MSTKFIRNEEDFTCENCGNEVSGNGYTNHCPKCLWSKHVDVNPGDRAENCGGLMEPVALISRNKKYILTHRCIKCGYEKNNKTAPEDNLTVLLG